MNTAQTGGTKAIRASLEQEVSKQSGLVFVSAVPCSETTQYNATTSDSTHIY